MLKRSHKYAKGQRVQVNWGYGWEDGAIIYRLQHGIFGQPKYAIDQYGLTQRVPERKIQAQLKTER